MNNHYTNIFDVFGIDIDELNRLNDVCGSILTDMDTKEKEKVYQDMKDEYWFAEGSGCNITENIKCAVWSVLEKYM